MHLFAIRVDEALCTEQRQMLKTQVDPQQIHAIERYRFVQDRDVRLVTHSLLRIMLQQTYGLRHDELEMATNPFGKPFLVQQALHVNLSHSGQWAFCAIDEQPIGIDIERRARVDMDSIAAFFSKREQALLHACEGDERLTLFYQLWTLKESYVKQIGKGLSYPLDAFSIVDFDGQWRLRVGDEILNDVYFRTYMIDSAYEAAVCSGHSRFPHSIQVWRVDELCTLAARISADSVL